MPRPTGWTTDADAVIRAALDQPLPTPALREAMGRIISRYGTPLPVVQSKPSEPVR